MPSSVLFDGPIDGRNWFTEVWPAYLQDCISTAVLVTGQWFELTVHRNGTLTPTSAVRAEIMRKQTAGP